MAAKYPSNNPSFTTKNTNDIVAASHPNSVQDEIVAIGTALVTGGLAHNLVPDSDSLRDFGSASKAWANIYVDTLNLTDGIRQTFNPDATNAGLNAGAVAGNPSSPTNGDIWYNSSTEELMARVNGASKAIVYVDTSRADGRLTLTSGTAVTTADVTAAATLYYTPFMGNQIALYTGSAWTYHTLTELSVALSGGTASKVHDVFLDYNDGTPQLAILVWTNDTTRATALTTQDGVLVKTGDTQQRYLGSIYVDSSNQCAVSAAKCYVWNLKHRRFRPMRVLEATNSWTYTTATWRQANGAGGNQLDIVLGLNEDALDAEVQAAYYNASATVRANVGIGLDSTSAIATGLVYHRGDPSTANETSYVGAKWRGYIGIGRHVVVWLEYSVATGTTTWFGDDNGQIVQSGISAGVWA